MRYNFLFIIFNSFVLLSVIIILKPFYSSTGINQFLPIKSNYENNQIKDLKNIQIDSLASYFVNTDNYQNIGLINQIADNLINQKKEDAMIKMKIYSVILNENNLLFKTYSNSEKTLDTLYSAYHWAVNFKTLTSISDGNKKQLYNVIYEYWMTEITESMERIIKTEPDLGYTNKYQVIKTLCQSSGYTTTLKTSNSEKVLYNIENSRFRYIAGRFYLEFGNLGIFLVIMLGIITILAYIQLFIKLKPYIYNEK
jgi:hypothetical protein